MKIIFGLALGIVLGTFATLWQHPSHQWNTDAQVAAGEWKIEVQTPPCDSAKNIQVIYPVESGAPMTIECDSLPVAEK
jgi:hypothetical protein